MRATFVYVALAACLVLAVSLFLLFAAGGTDRWWIFVLLAVAMTIPAAGLARIARLLHGQAAEIRASRRPGEVVVFPDHFRIHFPGVLARDLVLTASQIRAVCVDDGRPAWATLCWCRFPIFCSSTGSRQVGCLFRPGLRNAFQLIAPGPGIPNVALVFTQPLRFAEATGLGRTGEALAVVSAQFEDIETTGDLPGARPIDPLRDHRGIFLKVDSVASARQAFATWPMMRQVLRDIDTPLVPATAMPGPGRKVAGAIGFVAILAALLLASFAVVAGTWALLVWILAAAAAATLVYETFRNLTGLVGQRRAGAVSLMVALCMTLTSLVLGVLELPDILELDDPPSRERERVPTIPTIPTFPTPSYGLPEDPFPSQGTWDPMRP